MRLRQSVQSVQVALGLVLLGLLAQAAVGASYDGLLTVNVAEETTGTPLAVRMELRNAKGRPVRIRPAGAVVLDDYLVFEGSVTLELKQGKYQFLIEAGPEFQTRQGHFTIDRHAEDSTDVKLTRRVNMQQEGWWAGDLDVSLPPDQMPLLMRAAGVDFVPLTVEANLRGKCQELRLPGKPFASDLSPPLFGPWGALDYRQGGGALLLAEETPLEVCKLPAEASSLQTLRSAKDRGDCVVALSPFAWDLPVWIAEGQLDAVAVIQRHALVDRAIDNEDWGYPRDKKFYPGAMGNGRWSEAIYHHLLNCGVRIPPAAGSGAGTNGNPLGTNRVYAYCNTDLSRQAWLEALRAGHVMVTNGPLLRTKVEGYPPGHVFSLQPGEEHAFQIALSLTFYERAPVEYLEILKNGEVVHQVRLKELAQQQGRLPPLSFRNSGWFAVRAMTSNLENYQFATTGPYYVVAGDTPRISRRSVKFFLDWLDAAEQKFAKSPSALEDIQAARPFWSGLLESANAE